MTLAIERPAQDPSTRDVKFLPDCPPWCIGEPDWHDPDYIVVHASEHHGEKVPMSGHGWDAERFALHLLAIVALGREGGEVR